MTNYLIVPGYGNSGPNHWQSHYEKKLPNCVRIEQKSWDAPTMRDWVTEIDHAVKQYQPETVVLISHSLGGIAIAHWANQYHVKIKGAMIVAPPDVENPFQELGLASFTPIPLEPLPFPSIVVASSNDHWATLERTILFAESWGSELVNIGEAKHINVGSGHHEWEEGLVILGRLG
jgi:uncharacterized protein